MASSIFNMTDTWTLGGGPYTAIKMNATDNDPSTSSLLLDLQVGGASKFQVNKSGAITSASGTFFDGSITFGGSLSGNNPIYRISPTNGGLSLGYEGVVLSVNSSLKWTSGNPTTGNQNGDLILTRAAAATLQLGAADTTGTTAPTAQFLRVQSWSSSTNNNQAGANFTIQGSRGTGTGAGGSIIFQVAPAGGSSNGVQNAYSTALSIVQDLNTLGPGILLQGNTAQSIGVYAGRMFFGSQFGPVVGISSSGLVLSPTAYLSWVASGNAAGGAPELALYRDAANTLALRNGATAQTFNVYKTYTDASNYLRVALLSSGLAMEAAGTGGSDVLYIFNRTSNSIQFGTNNTGRWSINSSGHFLAETDNTFNIGASNANRPANIYIRGIFYSGPSGIALCDASSSPYGYLQSNASGVFRVTNAAGSDFSRLCFGDYTSSFPALKRSTTTLQVRLADDSGDAAFQCGTATSGGTAFNVNGTGGNSIASVTNTTTGTLLQVLNSTSNPLMTVTDTTSGTLFSVQSTTAATLFSVNDTTSGTLLAVTNSSATDVFTVADTGVSSFTYSGNEIFRAGITGGCYARLITTENYYSCYNSLANALNNGSTGRTTYIASSAVNTTGSFGLAPTDAYSADTYIARVAARTVSVRGTSNTPGILSLATYSAAGTAITAASTAGAGAIAFASDATATTPRSTYASGGSNFVMLMSDGTNWLIVA